jgi:hypothetical protein
MKRDGVSVPKTRHAAHFGRPALAALAVCVGLALGAATLAQQASNDGSRAAEYGVGVTATQLASIDGRSFSGVDLRAPLTDVSLNLAAVRAAAWRENAGALGEVAGATSRLLLEGDVRITLGPYRFTGSRAVLWLEPVRVQNDAGATVDAEQIAIFLDDAVEGDRSAAPPPPGRPEPIVADVTANADVSLDEPPSDRRQQADRLLVTALIPAGPTDLAVDSLQRGRPRFGDRATFLQDAEGRLARRLRALAVAEGRGPIVERAAPRTPEQVTAQGFEFADERFEDTRDDAPTPPAGDIRLPRRGLLTLQAPNFTQVAAEDEDAQGDAVLLTGGIGLEFQPLDRDGVVRLTAQRAVVFLEPESGLDIRTLRLGSEDVAGVYLEGDVNVVSLQGPAAAGGAIGGRYHLRGSRVFYEPASERAVLLDAVFWTYDQARGMPLYVRAETIRQTSLDQWTADRATLANVAFAEPHFAVGVEDVTVTRQPRPDGGADIDVTARDVTFRAGDVPLFYLPTVKGDYKPSAFQELRFESEDGDPIVRTRWDLYTLLGVDAAPGNTAALLVDGYFDRGPAVGTELTWDTTRATGLFFGYYIRDDGTDRLTTGARIDQDDEDRGLVLGETIFRPDGPWKIYAELSLVSDPAFVDAFFEEQAETRREFISGVRGLRLDQNERNSALAVDLFASFDDYLPNEYLLQSRGRQVERLPEVGYDIVGADLDRLGLSYFTESSLGVLAFDFPENTLEEQGFDTPQLADDAFGLDPDDNFDDALQAQGFTDDAVLRVDTRHEFVRPFAIGEVDLAPYAVGRLTAWDDDFSEFNDGDDVDDTRAFGALGLRASTTFQRIDNDAHSRIFDVERLRHLIEPHIHLWTGGANVNQRRLPVYDEGVESLATGTAVAVGLDNTWQTKRGPEGRERSVDWLTLDLEYVWSSETTRRESPIGRFDSVRPERSYLGTDFFSGESALALTDAVALTARGQYDVNESIVPFAGAGVQIDHGFGYSSFLEYRELDEPALALLTGGARYELTRKYAVELELSYEVVDQDLTSLGARFTRRFPQWTLDVGLDVDDTRDTVGIAFTVRPVGFAGETRERTFTEQFLRSGGPRTTAPVGVLDRRLNSGPFGG